MPLGTIYKVTQDLQGNAVTGVLGTVVHTGTGTLAQLYANVEGTLPLPNPTTNHAEFGSFSLFLGAGTYDMSFVKAGYIFETQTRITVRDPAAGVNQIIGFPNRILTTPLDGIGTVTLYTPQDIAPDSAVQFAHLGLGIPPDGINELAVSGQATITGTLGIAGTATYPLDVFGLTRLGGAVGILAPPDGAHALSIVGSILQSGGNVGLGGVATYGMDIFYDTYLSTRLGVGAPPMAPYALVVTGSVVQSGGNVGFGGAPTSPFHVFGQASFNAPMGIQKAAATNTVLGLAVQKTTQYGITVQAVDVDTLGSLLEFFAVAGTTVGSITTTATTTAYNTASDARLKHNVATLTGELPLIQALRPVRFRWNVDDSEGVGFLAHEVAALVSDVIMGEPGAVEEDGRIRPQMIDYSKLVPWLVGAIQTIVQRLEVVEDAAGI